MTGDPGPSTPVSVAEQRRKALYEKVEEALQGDGMVLAIKYKNGKIYLFRHTEAFPKAEIETVLRLVTEDLTKVNMAPPVG